MGPDDFPLPHHVGSGDLPHGWERLLLARISDGDGDALLELRWRWGEWICGRVYHLTRDWLAASLLTSGVFARLWRAPADFESGGLWHSLLSLAEQRAHQWMASNPEDFEMAGTTESSSFQPTQEKSTNQLAMWWQLIAAFEQLQAAWDNALPLADTPGGNQLPANVAVALARAGRAGAEATAGVAAVLAQQADSGRTFRELALVTRQAGVAWPARETRV